MDSGTRCIRDGSSSCNAHSCIIVYHIGWEQDGRSFLVCRDRGWMSGGLVPVLRHMTIRAGLTKQTIALARRTGTRPPHPLRPSPCPYSMANVFIPSLDRQHAPDLSKKHVRAGLVPTLTCLLLIQNPIRKWTGLCRRRRDESGRYRYAA